MYIQNEYVAIQQSSKKRNITHNKKKYKYLEMNKKEEEMIASKNFPLLHNLIKKLWFQN